ncbi:MAG: Uma2 family endonuclease [Coleofasciculaceae cyanobacterium SM2_1_6]|nr:Uma2 family endonuclease [Coleofasciculaceae cyanobacterium SM2_1_6]
MRNPRSAGVSQLLFCPSYVFLCYSNLIIVWGNPALKDNCPDVMVVFAVKEKGRIRSKFFVEQEGVRLGLIIEVVSPHYRQEDREIKVIQYAQAGVPEYLII